MDDINRKDQGPLSTLTQTASANTFSNVSALSVKKQQTRPKIERPSREKAEEAVRTLLAWAGDDPDREGLIETPARVTRAYEEFFAGYEEDPEIELKKTFEQVGGYSHMVLLRDIAVASHCEHHMVPILGKAHVAYLPTNKVVGLSKLARVVEIFARRLQTQETMTVDIARTIEHVLEPAGVAVQIEAAHQCMTTRGIRNPGVVTITTHLTGVFLNDERWERRFAEQIRGSGT